MSKETAEALVDVYYSLAVHAYAAAKTADDMRRIDKKHQEAGGVEDTYLLGLASGFESEARAFKRQADEIAKKLKGADVEAMSWEARYSLKLGMKTLGEAGV